MMFLIIEIAKEQHDDKNSNELIELTKALYEGVNSLLSQ